MQAEHIAVTLVNAYVWDDLPTDGALTVTREGFRLAALEYEIEGLVPHEFYSFELKFLRLVKGGEATTSKIMYDGVQYMNGFRKGEEWARDGSVIFSNVTITNIAENIRHPIVYLPGYHHYMPALVINKRTATGEIHEIDQFLFECTAFYLAAASYRDQPVSHLKGRKLSVEEYRSQKRKFLENKRREALIAARAENGGNSKSPRDHPAPQSLFSPIRFSPAGVQIPVSNSNQENSQPPRFAPHYQPPQYQNYHHPYGQRFAQPGYNSNNVSLPPQRHNMNHFPQSSFNSFETSLPIQHPNYYHPVNQQVLPPAFYFPSPPLYPNNYVRMAPVPVPVVYFPQPAHNYNNPVGMAPVGRMPVPFPIAHHPAPPPPANQAYQAYQALNETSDSLYFM